MHEYSLASEIADIVISVGKENNFTKIRQIDVDVGEFSFINPEQVIFWLKLLAEEDPNYNLIRGTDFKFHQKKGIINCLQCNYQGSSSNQLDSASMHLLVDVIITCPRCGSHSTTITQGRDVVVSSIQGN